MHDLPNALWVKAKGGAERKAQAVYRVGGHIPGTRQPRTDSLSPVVCWGPVSLLSYPSRGNNSASEQPAVNSVWGANPLYRLLSSA